MSKNLKKDIAAGKAIHRAQILTILQVALQAGEERFVRTLSEAWLDAYPYDLPVEYIRAQALMQEGKHEKALAVLKRTTELDPEYREAQDLLAHIARRVKPELAETARAAAIAVSDVAEAPQDIEQWAQMLIRGQNALNSDNLEEAEGQIQAALLSQPPSPLPAIYHLRLAARQQLSWLALRNLVDLYAQQWPHTLHFQLLLAENLIESGEEDEAVDILHRCVAEDVGGQVARRLWGENHRFQALWPRELTHAIDVPIPAEVAAGLGWNNLESGEGRQETADIKSGELEESEVEFLDLDEFEAADGEFADEFEVALLDEAEEDEAQIAEPEEAQEEEEEDLPPIASEMLEKSMRVVKEPELEETPEIEEVNPQPAAKQEGPSTLPETPLDLEEVVGQSDAELQLRADGRFPKYILLSTKEGLQKQYGRAALKEIDGAMRSVARATTQQANWDAALIYADDQACLDRYGLKAVKPNDPWAIKNLLTDLDESLRANGEMIGALLIVGGPKVIPFHLLPNPVDDDDREVPSDNPYGSIDENFFVPTWPVGRLPGDQDDNPKLLLKSLERIVSSRTASAAKSFSPTDFIDRLLALLRIGGSKQKSFGYSAEIWQRASHSVFRTIGEPRRLTISPPTQTGALPKEVANPLELAYFNLHGLEDAGEWYGQRDPLGSHEGPDYPIALSPSDVLNSGRAPQVVFSEACFGANVIGKTAEDALALKFLDSGSKAVVGSTCTAYGSVAAPLIAADLLGQTFWKLLNEGHPVGEALRRAKIALARAMHRRQGYLDGEDQKTLISFILYGDPLAQAVGQGPAPKRIMRPEEGSEDIQAICDKAEVRVSAPQDIPADTLATVKSVVAEYLPGMRESAITVSHEHLECRGHDCNLPHKHAKALPGLAPSRQLVTLSKRVERDGRQHPSYARITMDSHGKMVKLAVSR